MKKEIILITIMAIILVVLLAILVLPFKKPDADQQPKAGINITSIERIDNTFSDIKIKGYVNGDGWIAFEAQVGVVIFFDKDNSELGYALLTATGEWMVPPPINFEGQIRMTPKEADSVTKLVFRNENPSGEPSRDKEFVMETKLVRTQGETAVVNAYLNNNKMDPEILCNKVFPAQRNIIKTQAVARAALQELLLGPTNSELDAGFFTSINKGVKIQSLTIENGVAKVDFDEQLEFQVGGSCRVSAIRAQITQTLKQFSTVNSVVISINGRTEDILQP